MAEPIRISALGRDVQVGDIYNYFSDAILPNCRFQVLNEWKPTPEKVYAFFYQQPDKFKGCMLGIHSHLQNSIDQGVVDLNELWFANYVKPNPSEGDDMARVDVFIKVVQQTEFLNQQFINSKMYEYKLNTGGSATHLVEEVVYGAEFICSMQRKIDQEETKESAEENLSRETKIYFDHIISTNPMFTTPPVKLRNEVRCKIFSSLSKANDFMEGSFEQSITWLRRAIIVEKENLTVPVEILLRFIPEQIETRLQSEKWIDTRINIERSWHWIVLESGRISKIATLDRVSPLAKVICQFRDLLAPLWNAIEKYYANITLVTVSSPDQGLKGFQPIQETLLAMTDWLAHRRNEIQFICSLLDGTNLVALDWKDIEAKTLTNDEKVAKVFVLKVDYKENPLVERIQNIVGNQTSVFKLPVFSITNLQEKRLLDEVRNKLHEFANEADLSRWGPNRDTSYYIALVPNSSSLDDGTIQEYSGKASNLICQLIEDNSINSQEKLQQNNLNSFTPNSQLPPPLTPKTDVPNLNQQQNQIGNCGHISATASPVTTNTTSGDHENQMGMEIEASSALSTDSETTEDAGNNNGTANSKMVQFWVKTETPPSMQLENADNTEIESNDATPISGNVEAEQDLIDHTTAKMKIDDVAEETPSHKTSTVADPIQKSSDIAGGKQKVKQRSDSNDRETHVGQSDPKLDRSKSGSQSNPKRHARNLSDSFREERDGTTDKDGERRCKDSTDKDDTKQENNYDDGRRGMHNEEFPSNRRVAEIFSDTSQEFSTLIKKGRPYVYLLNAKETSISQDFRWFDIGRSNTSTLPSKHHRDHKVIILMGATGCGKSTLINGMVNYILGVKWNDPFRFKCVREDETTARNQAHSQTSTVTAYTLRHHDGMAVPYSITIIDTPGYGDTRGISRDKLITRNIHQFLTQKENSVDQIHAACFVAASGDSRLTATQRYIIDSVLSIFGKDVKENMRLLVTFADNADPPVVEACLAANFPVTSASAGISYSKFNSSVLYANNEQQGDDDFCFDELFWDMGQENFYKFFIMLENMNGRNLKSTREVIQRRDLLEQSLKDIEQELEVCLVNIENMEMFRRRMREYGHKMETNKNFVVEKTEMQYAKMNCDKGFKAYNCHRCKRTCEPRVKEFKKRECTSNNCPCPIFEHEFQTFEWHPRWVTVKTTLLDMKAEFESNYDDKMTTEQLLTNCLTELDLTKAKVLSLLDQVGINARSLESTALRSNALSPSDYLSLMRSRVAEEQAPGYLTRLETLTELQQRLAGIVPKRQTQTFATSPGSHPGDMPWKQHNSTIRQENCWKETKTNQQSEVHQQEEPKGAPKSTKYFAFITKWKY